VHEREAGRGVKKMSRVAIFDDLKSFDAGDEALVETLMELRAMHRRKWIFRDICRECSAKYPCDVRSLIDTKFYHTLGSSFYWVGGGRDVMVDALKSIWYRHRQSVLLVGSCDKCGGRYPCKSRALIDGRFWWFKR